MLRRVALPLCSLVVAVVATAAPAPVYRPPMASGVWVNGWDEPLDPKGDCRFDRRGDRLTLTMPGKGLAGQDAPHLLREVVGDFQLTVRAGGEFLPGKDGGRSAGVVIVSGRNRCRLERWGVRGEVVMQGIDATWHCDGQCKGHNEGCDRNPPRKHAYFRVTRKGDVMQLEVSEDASAWRVMFDQYPFAKKLPKILKVGVYAEATAEGEFKPVFDQVKLTRPAK